MANNRILLCQGKKTHSPDSNPYTSHHIMSGSEPNSPPSAPRTRAPVPTPVPAYLPTAGTPLAVDKSLYDAVQGAPRVLVRSFTRLVRLLGVLGVLLLAEVYIAGITKRGNFGV